MPYLEASGRVTDVERALRDLSLDAKLRLPLDLLWPEAPFALAVGTQDEGGAAPHFRTRYAVASARFGRVAASVGYGAGPDRMKGAFGGASLRLTSFAEALGDWDGLDLDAGVRLGVPLRLLGVPLRLDAIAKTSLSHRPVRVEWGAGVTFPIGLASEREERASTTPAAPSAAAEPTEDATSTALGTLQRELVDAGFENVRVGVDGTVVVVEYENDVYSHAEVDALGVVLGHVAWRAPPGLDRFAVVLERTQLPLAEISGPLSSLRAWFGAAEERGEAALPEVLALSWHPRRRDGAWWDDAPARRSALRSQLVLAPGLVTYVATEISALEYVLSLRPELRVPLWPGALAYGRWDVPFVWSAALADGGALRSRRAAPRLVDALLYQALPLAPGVTALAGAGVFQVNGAGGLGEVTWTPGGGDLALAVHGAFTRVVQGADTGKRHESLVASVRWRYAPLALVATVSGGRFYEGDRGAEVELARWFRDTSVGVFYAHTGVSVVGVRLTLPLTPRREMTPGLLQVRGTPRWEYDVFSVVQHRTNDIVSGVAVQPVTPWNLEDAYRDASRLTLEALARELPRARAAFQRSLE